MIQYKKYKSRIYESIVVLTADLNTCYSPKPATHQKEVCLQCSKISHYVKKKIDDVFKYYLILHLDHNSIFDYKYKKSHAGMVTQGVRANKLSFHFAIS